MKLWPNFIYHLIRLRSFSNLSEMAIVLTLLYDRKCPLISCGGLSPFGPAIERGVCVCVFRRCPRKAQRTRSAPELIEIIGSERERMLPSLKWNEDNDRFIKTVMVSGYLLRLKRNEMDFFATGWMRVSRFICTVTRWPWPEHHSKCGLKTSNRRERRSIQFTAIQNWPRRPSVPWTKRYHLSRCLCVSASSAKHSPNSAERKKNNRKCFVLGDGVATASFLCRTTKFLFILVHFHSHFFLRPCMCVCVCVAIFGSSFFAQSCNYAIYFLSYHPSICIKQWRNKNRCRCRWSNRDTTARTHTENDRTNAMRAAAAALRVEKKINKFS